MMITQPQLDVASASYVTFNTSLASRHTYLGEIDDAYHRMSFLDGGRILTLPMIDLEGVVLFPDATLPLRIIEPRMVAAVERSMAQTNTGYMIAVVRIVNRSPSIGFRLGTPQFARIGTTAEIRQFKRLEDGSLNLVARGQQRFLLRRYWVDADFVPNAEVQIINEDEPLRTPRAAFAQLASVPNPSHNHRPAPLHPDEDEEEEKYWEERSSDSSSDDDLVLDPLNMRPIRGSLASSPVEQFKKETGLAAHTRKGSYQAPLAFWPRWVYELYDSFALARRAAEIWKQVIGLPSLDGLVKNPGSLSFRIASKLPLSDSTRQDLLEVNGISYRLQKEIQLLESFDRVRCRSCQVLIGRRRDMVVMSTDGPLNAYVNPNGYVHEIMTLTRASGLALIGPAVTEHSWFPGYAWTITRCATCESYMGWLFTAIGPTLRPRSFWGIRSSQVLDDAS
ncbi:ATP-dependent protease La (LON) domain protein isoform X2 [Wolffia australiana]